MSKTLKAVAVVSATAAILMLSPPSAAESPDEPRVARLVRELGADAFAVRKQATEELAKLGPSARREIEAATRSSDPEVRLRAKDLLRDINEYELWAPSRCELPAEPTPAAEIVRLLTAQTGNHVRLVDDEDDLGATLIAVDPAVTEYWPLIDHLCGQLKLTCRQQFDSRRRGIVLAAGAASREPAAYAGPIRARITSARRTFNEEMNYEETRSERTHTFQLSLEMSWEDRFRLVAYRSEPQLVEAVTDAGPMRALRPAGGGWNVVSPGAREVTMSLRTSPPKASARKIDVLRLRWGLIAVGDMTKLSIADLESREQHFQDDLELSIDTFQPAKNDRYELSIVVRRHRNLPEPAELLFAEHELELLDAEGRPLRRIMTANVLSEHGATIKATFAADEGVKPAKLEFHYPRLRSARDMEVVFRNVPLPTARPE